MYRLLRDIVIFVVVVILFILLLLFPREMVVEHDYGLVFRASFPYTFDMYKENMQDFIEHVKLEKGLGTTEAGTPLIKHAQRYVIRSLKIILPAFLTSMIVGTVIGVLLFPLRNRRQRRLLTSLAEMFAAIPDFFLFISLQYLLIIAMNQGFPKFNLYSSDEWYSFIFPCISLTIFPLFHMIRLTLATMNDEAGEDYVQTAMAKGMSKGRVIRHIFANVWGTIVNQSQMVMLYILSSLPIIEKLANYHGAGYQLLESILNNDNLYAIAFFFPLLIFMHMTVLISQIPRRFTRDSDVRQV